MKAKLISIDSLAVAAALAMATLSGQAQNVVTTDSLTPLGSSGGVFQYSLQVNNTGAEAIQSFWLGWIPGSFNVSSPSSAGNNLGWTSVLDGSSIQYGGTAGTALASGHSGTFTFSSTTTPAEFMAQTGQAGQSTAYGVNAANGQLSFTLSGADTETFGLTLVVPEPSTFAILGLGSLVLLVALRRKPSFAKVRIP
jgi:PEP-CTERM motif